MGWHEVSPSSLVIWCVRNVVSVRVKNEVSCGGAEASCV